MKLKAYLEKENRKQRWLEEHLKRHKQTISLYVRGAAAIPYQDAKLIEILTKGEVTMAEMGHKGD